MTVTASLLRPGSLFENNINHNAAFGAMNLWSFTTAYYKQSKRAHGPHLGELMLVLPVTLHSASVRALAPKRRDTAIPKALADDRTILAGMQERMEGFADRTFRALRLAIGCGLLSQNQAKELIPGRMSRPFDYSMDSLNDALTAADRLGHWVSLAGFQTACNVLGVRF